MRVLQVYLYLRGRQEGQQKLGVMAEQVRSVRINDSLWSALEDLTARLNRIPEVTMTQGTLTVSKVLRLALFEGIMVLAKRYGINLSKSQEVTNV